MPREVLFIIDAGPDYGVGHITRTADLARLLAARGYKCSVWVRSKNGSKGFERRFFSGPVRVLRSQDDLTPFLRPDAVHCVIVDVLKLPAVRLVRPFFERKIPIVLIGNYERVPEWVSFCISTHLKPRKIAAGTPVVSGPAYTVLSRAFASYRQASSGPRSLRKRAREILVLPGGGNTGGMVFKILRALNGLPDSCRVSLVLGALFTKKNELSKTLHGFDGRINVFYDVSQQAMLRLMKKADIAILSFGRTIDEARALGLPAVVLSSSVLNDKGSREAASQGGVDYLGDFRKVSAGKMRREIARLMDDLERRERLSREGRRLIDGLGADRMIRAICGVLRRSAAGGAIR